MNPHELPETRDDFDEAERLLADVLSAPPGEAPTALERACRENPPLADELRERFRLLEQAGLVPKAESAAEEFPERLGDFRLLRRLGGGGMGVVFLASQESLGREVALKLVRPELLYFPGARERFQREVRAIAALQHPGIVPVYAVGEENGIPYFAMERVPGCTLAQILDALRDRAPETLTRSDLEAAFQAASGEVLEPIGGATASWVDWAADLARQTALALEHVHERGLLHRDVKPSNIALHRDGRAMLLDFGLSSGGEVERITRSGSPVGTLAYMSPEQLRGDQSRVDARSDLYALGVTLYELLTFQMPYRGDTALSLQKHILEGRLDSIRARNRRVSYDLETVCLKAMDVEPPRRYPSAAEFAADLGRVERREAIRAFAPGPISKLVRWAARNPSRATAVALGIGLTVGIPVSLWMQASAHASELEELNQQLSERNRELNTTLAALRERGVEQQFTVEFLQGVFRSASPLETAGVEMTARQLLESGVRRADAELTHIPAVQAGLLTYMASGFQGLMEHKRSVELFRRALPVFEARKGRKNAETASVLAQLADSLIVLDELDEAEKLASEAVASLRENDDERRLKLASALNVLGKIQWRRLRMAEAESSLLESLDLYEKQPNADVSSHLACEADYAALVGQDDSRLDEAVQRMRECFHRASGTFGSLHPNFAVTVNNLALALKKRGDLEAAQSLYEQALAGMERIYGRDSLNVGIVHANLAQLLDARGKRAEADAFYRSAYDVIFRATGREDHQSTMIALGNLAGYLVSQGKFFEAAPLLTRVLPLQRKHFGEHHRATAVTIQRLAQCSAHLESPEALVPRVAEFVREWEAVPGVTKEELADAYNSAIGMLSRAGRFQDALPWLERFYKQAREIPRFRRAAMSAAERLGQEATTGADRLRWMAASEAVLEEIAEEPLAGKLELALQHAKVLAENQNLAEARARWRSIVERGKQESSAWSQVVTAASQMARFEQKSEHALEWFELACDVGIRFAPESDLTWLARLGRARHRILLGRLEGVAAELDAAETAAASLKDSGEFVRSVVRQLRSALR